MNNPTRRLQNDPHPPEEATVPEHPERQTEARVDLHLAQVEQREPRSSGGALDHQLAGGDPVGLNAHLPTKMSTAASTPPHAYGAPEARTATAPIASTRR